MYIYKDVKCYLKPLNALLCKMELDHLYPAGCGGVNNGVRIWHELQTTGQTERWDKFL